MTDDYAVSGSELTGWESGRAAGVPGGFRGDINEMTSDSAARETTMGTIALTAKTTTPPTTCITDTL